MTIDGKTLKLWASCVDDNDVIGIREEDGDSALIILVEGTDDIGCMLPVGPFPPPRGVFLELIDSAVEKAPCGCELQILTDQTDEYPDITKFFMCDMHAMSETLAESLDNATAALSSCLAHHGKNMPVNDRYSRNQTVNKATALLNKLKKST